MTAWKVYEEKRNLHTGGTNTVEIDTVFYDSDCDAEYVLKTLTGSGGMISIEPEDLLESFPAPLTLEEVKEMQRDCCIPWNWLDNIDQYGKVDRIAIITEWGKYLGFEPVDIEIAEESKY